MKILHLTVEDGTQPIVEAIASAVTEGLRIKGLDKDYHVIVSDDKIKTEFVELNIADNREFVKAVTDEIADRLINSNDD